MDKKSFQSKDNIKQEYSFKDIIGRDKTITNIVNLIEKIKDVDVPILIKGESGVGKEFFARVIHYNSIRREDPFLMVNCGAIPENLMESEFFGHKKGAFTGAIHEKTGYIKAAGSGTVFLDEIDDLTFHLQVKLLHLLQSGEYSPVGSSNFEVTNARFIAATKHSLKELVSIGKFRDDLFYRLNVLRIDIPPLRNRKADIPVLCDYFLDRHCKKLEKNKLRLNPRTLDALLKYDFPGNVRELENILKRAIIFCESEVIDLNHLSFDIQDNIMSMASREICDECFAEAKRSVIEEFEKKYLTKKLEECHGVILKAARHAGMYESNFREKIKKYGIPIDKFKG